MYAGRLPDRSANSAINTGTIPCVHFTLSALSYDIFWLNWRPHQIHKHGDINRRGCHVKVVTDLERISHCCKRMYKVKIPDLVPGSTSCFPCMTPKSKKNQRQ